MFLSVNQAIKLEIGLEYYKVFIFGLAIKMSSLDKMRERERERERKRERERERERKKERKKEGERVRGGREEFKDQRNKSSVSIDTLLLSVIL